MKVFRLVSTLLLNLVAAGQAHGDPINITSGHLDLNPFSGPLLLIGDRGGSIVEVIFPFLFDGTFFHPVDAGLVGDALTGSGLATLRLSPGLAFPGTWHLDHARYDFLDPPAPLSCARAGTLVLIGSGLFGLAALFKTRQPALNDRCGAELATRSERPHQRRREQQSCSACALAGRLKEANPFRITLADASISAYVNGLHIHGLHASLQDSDEGLWRPSRFSEPPWCMSDADRYLL